MVRTSYALLTVLTAAVLVGVACILYTGHAQQESDRRWCDLLVTLDAPASPPETERGAEIQRQIHALRVDLGCGGN